MMLSRLIAVLNDAEARFGDVPVSVIDSQSGYPWPMRAVIKIHPRKGLYDGMDKTKPVIGIGVLNSGNIEDDITLFTTIDRKQINT